MIVLVSQTKLPDSSNQVSDIVGAVHLVMHRFFYARYVTETADIAQTVAKK